MEISELEKESEKIEKDSGLVIFYTNKDDLEAEFEEIIKTYNIIPIIKNQRAKITEIKPFKKLIYILLLILIFQI